MSDEEVQELAVRVARIEEQIKALSETIKAQDKALSDKIHDLSVWLGILGSAVLIAAIKVIIQGVA